MSWFLITGSFACGMAFHNTTARYVYALARERLLPQVLGRTQARYPSAHIASTVQSVIAAVILLVFVLFATVDPKLGAGDSGGYPAGVRADGGDGGGLDPVHPGARALLAIKNLSSLGSGYSYAKWLCWGDVLIFVVGLGYAFYLKANDRDRYETVGRMINQGLDKV